MFEGNECLYAPLLLPSDEDGLADCGPLDAAVLPATAAVNPRLERFSRLVRERARTLIVDTRTPAFQYEGYVSQEDVRSLPYSPGRSTLSGLWAAEQFTRDFRATTIREVIQIQTHLGADVAVAPHFFVPSPDHPWLEIAVDMARESRSVAGKLPMAVAVQVDIDAILVEPVRQAFAEAFADGNADLFLLTVVNFDEREATPDETRAVLDLVARLTVSAPVVLQHVGRMGLAAMAHGAVGCAGGALELESYPQRYLREGLVNLHSDAHYLPEALLRLPVRLAAACAAAVPAMDTQSTAPTRLVRRVRIRHALDSKTAEARWLREQPPGDRQSALEARLASALLLCAEAQAQLGEDNGEQLSRSQFHYLEVLREIVGGPEAELLGGAGF